MNRRDAYMFGAVGVLAAVAAFWFLLLAPTRSELSKFNKEVQASESELQAARQEAQQFAQARLDFPTDYTTVARLGKAVPVDPDVPSLIVQLDRAANRAGVDFRRLVPQTAGGGSEAPPPVASAPPAPGGEGASAQGAGTTGASGAASGQAGATGAAGAAGGAAAGATGTSGSTSATPAANALLTPTIPLGVEVGSAGLALTRYSLLFQGSFFKMADFVHNIKSLVRRRNRQLVVSGRLVTVDGIAFVEGDAGFPQVKAAIAATAYLLPQSQGLFAGATSQGPVDATAATPAPPAGGAPSAPPAAVVSPQ